MCATKLDPAAGPADADARVSDRSDASLRAIVQVKESADEAWKEVTKVTTVSRNGAGFILSRPCTVGRLVNLVLPMPAEFRAYDTREDLYQVIGIVQYCNASTIGGKHVYHIGVGLIGKDVPESFTANPSQNYRISGMTADGLWGITEAASQFRNRKNPRYWVTLPTTVTLIHREDEKVRTEETFTHNVSADGISVATTLNARVGDRVRLACKPIDFHAIGVVRNIKRLSTKSATMHLEFDGQRFPVDLVTPAKGGSRES